MAQIWPDILNGQPKQWKGLIGHQNHAPPTKLMFNMITYTNKAFVGEGGLASDGVQMTAGGWG